MRVRRVNTTVSNLEVANISSGIAGYSKGIRIQGQSASGSSKDWREIAAADVSTPPMYILKVLGVFLDTKYPRKLLGGILWGEILVNHGPLSLL